MRYNSTYLYLKILDILKKSKKMTVHQKKKLP
ncbi:Putative protein [Zobellia galactanivorans]|uniref:Uncharacterized protein n=1 Tax=Zobellia galactanivorans (strain DSM 12802 / CCUG 47099 / CIP 106680 / NCIMB 13871 / Dsij) TaxID=63186 RepID=G0L4Q5_ZOBGA|nr:Putative protein [Zobellia galactanivorans]